MTLKEELYLDNILKEHLSKRVIIKESLYFQQILGSNAEEFLNFLDTDVFYEEIISEFNLSFKNKFSEAFNNFRKFDYGESYKILLDLIKTNENNDINSLDINSSKNVDVVINRKVELFKNLIKNIMDKKIDLRNYTIEI